MKSGFVRDICLALLLTTLLKDGALSMKVNTTVLALPVAPMTTLSYQSDGTSADVNIGLIAGLAVGCFVIISIQLTFIYLGLRYCRGKSETDPPTASNVYDDVNQELQSDVIVYQDLDETTSGSPPNSPPPSGLYVNTAETHYENNFAGNETQNYVNLGSCFQTVSA